MGEKVQEMIGSTKIEITHDTLVRAVQGYLDTQFTVGCAPKVEKVTLTRGSGDGYTNVVVVECTGAHTSAVAMETSP